ncbi:hypothetical protein LNJ08_12365 [Tenacibaculum finnmarkense genomovar ulcerans]|uniref:hypothetical protein n=1 Tax=Tenacibaculum finnmarkense TaxID=2781243 RepID=UPI001E2D686A|nr:hypothetical protein [Tenacibaculum finnmarkense]MCD8455184.1 hypothetical protein [Tenacibaculum finnmarkense genomovar ulcerans]
MKIPNLPTDNLYKFLALFGLVLIIFSSYNFNKTISEAYQFEDNLKLKKSLYEIESIEKAKDSLTLQKSKLEIDKDHRLYDRIVKKIPNIFYSHIGLLLFGIGLSLLGFILWYFKTQKLNDKILVDQANRITNDKSILVHKMQFEKEFEVYRELWPELMKLKTATLELRPICEIIPNGATKEEIEKEKSKNFNEPFIACAKIFLENKPFYPKDIFEEVESMLKTSREEAYEWKDTIENRLSNYKNAKKNIDKITSNIDEICLKIRDRIGLLKLKN